MKQLKNIFKPIHLMFENISFLGTKYKKAWEEAIKYLKEQNKKGDSSE